MVPFCLEKWRWGGMGRGGVCGNHDSLFALSINVAVTHTHRASIGLCRLYGIPQLVGLDHARRLARLSTNL